MGARQLFCWTVLGWTGLGCSGLLCSDQVSSGLVLFLSGLILSSSALARCLLCFIFHVSALAGETQSSIFGGKGQVVSPSQRGTDSYRQKSLNDRHLGCFNVHVGPLPIF